MAMRGLTLVETPHPQREHQGLSLGILVLAGSEVTKNAQKGSLINFSLFAIVKREYIFINNTLAQ